MMPDQGYSRRQDTVVHCIGVHVQISVPSHMRHLMNVIKEEPKLQTPSAIDIAIHHIIETDFDP
jgi:hypothetical protein